MINQTTMGEMSTHFKINIAEKTKHFTYVADAFTVCLNIAAPTEY